MMATRIILVKSFLYTFKKSKKTFVGVGEFVDETENNLTKLEELIPGTFKDDPVYEEMMKRSSEFYEYVKEVLSRKSKTKMNIEQATRFYGLLLLYIGRNLSTFSIRRGRDSMIVKIIKCPVFLSSIILPANCSLLNFCSKPQIQ